jgi:hypothetical protein
VVNRILLLFLTLFIFFPSLSGIAKAKTTNLPEKNGVYPVPGHPELRLRVFVHPARGSRPPKPTPTPTPTPVLNCSLTDPGSDTVSSITGWYLPSTFGYYLNSNSVPASVGSQNLGTIAGNGFSQWEAAVSNKVNMEYAGDTGLTRAKLDGTNIIAWGRAANGTLGITYIWSYAGGEVAEVDTIMNKSYPWTWSDPAGWGGSFCAYTQTYDAQDILTHELGHWYGVDDDYADKYANNTMYGYGDVMETKKDTLTAGDTVAVRSVYP